MNTTAEEKNRVKDGMNNMKDIVNGSEPGMGKADSKTQL